MNTHSVKIISISQEEKTSELWFYTIDGISGEHATYLPTGATIEEAASKIARVAAKNKGDSRLGKYKFIEGGAPQKIKANDELEEELKKLKDKVDKLEKKHG